MHPASKGSLPTIWTFPTYGLGHSRGRPVPPILAIPPLLPQTPAPTGESGTQVQVRNNAIVRVGRGAHAARFEAKLPLALIAGPCQTESRALALETAAALKEIAARRGIGLVYKSSFEANRTARTNFGRQPPSPTRAEAIDTPPPSIASPSARTDGGFMVALPGARVRDTSRTATLITGLRRSLPAICHRTESGAVMFRPTSMHSREPELRKVVTPEIVFGAC